MKNIELAQTLFPDVSRRISDLELDYPNRSLPEGAEVTRFAPSPTGFLHTGSLFTSMVASKLAEQTGGVFMLRLEDTDSKREISGSGNELVEQLAQFKVTIGEGYLGDSEKGSYGPYKQSDRSEIYKAVIKEMVEQGKAYPCFATVEELDALRKQQQEEGVVPGYYGKYAKYRDLSPDEAIELVKSGKTFVMRFRSDGDHRRYIKIKDVIRGDLELSENDQDIVIMKSDGLPTYHFAHVVDDHFMKTTTVTRGEEWLPSLPIHLQIFRSLGWKSPRYAHLPVINKMEDGAKRKLSKRKDPEAAVSFFMSAGYPVESIREYLMNIANSNFEEWRRNNPLSPMSEFKFKLEKMSLDGALFDIQKIDSISREVISKMTTEDLFARSYEYAKKYDQKLLDLIESDQNYYKRVINIEREKANPRKDFAKFSDIKSSIGFMYDESSLMKESFNPKLTDETISSVLKVFSDSLKLIGTTEEEWLSFLRENSSKIGFAISNKDYKADPTKFLGSFGDVMEVARIAITGSKQSPNLYEVIGVLGTTKADFRLKNKQ
jgi:glutamyl-tRNA synthetase